MTTSSTKRSVRRGGFTLVELLVVITIIGILAALLIPAVSAVIGRANTAAMRMEVENLSQAIEAYNSKYGDYPPDFSDWGLATRHFRKVFPNIQSSELVLLGALSNNGQGIDSSEALVFALGGYSSDAEFPFTGLGGPIATIDASKNVYGYNSDRDNSIFDFDPGRLGLDQNTMILRITDTLDGDIFPAYRREEDQEPFVYFDSRTYFAQVDLDSDGTPDDYNGFASIGVPGGVRPYIGDQPTPSGLPQFVNPKSFQVLSPGSDGRYGEFYRFAPNGSVYYQYPTGTLVTVEKDHSSAAAPTITFVTGSNGYLDSTYAPPGLTPTDNYQLDNVTNFTVNTLGEDFTE